jgi:hypothetical protein
VPYPITDAADFDKRIRAGETTEHTKATVYAEICKRSEAQRRSDETSARAFTRFITEEDDGRALYRAYKAVKGPDHAPAEVAQKACCTGPHAVPEASAEPRRRAPQARAQPHQGAGLQQGLLRPGRPRARPRKRGLSAARQRDQDFPVLQSPPF